MQSAVIRALRQQVWDKREVAFRANALAAQTRKPNLMADSRKKNDQLRKLSAYLLERIRATVEYQAGSIDLHGLTKDEAIQLVDWKLAESSSSPHHHYSSSIHQDIGAAANAKVHRRFHVITGKGNNSVNGQAVLGPALERHLTAKGVSFSSCHDGIISVLP